MVGNLQHGGDVVANVAELFALVFADADRADGSPTDEDGRGDRAGVDVVLPGILSTSAFGNGHHFGLDGRGVIGREVVEFGERNRIHQRLAG